jgi:hypothetical protein
MRLQRGPPERHPTGFGGGPRKEGRGSLRQDNLFFFFFSEKQQ